MVLSINSDHWQCRVRSAATRWALWAPTGHSGMPLWAPIGHSGMPLWAPIGHSGMPQLRGRGAGARFRCKPASHIFAVGGCLVKPSLVGFRALPPMCKLNCALYPPLAPVSPETVVQRRLVISAPHVQWLPDYYLESRCRTGGGAIMHVATCSTPPPPVLQSSAWPDPAIPEESIGLGLRLGLGLGSCTRLTRTRLQG